MNAVLPEFKRRLTDRMTGYAAGCTRLVAVVDAVRGDRFNHKGEYRGDRDAHADEMAKKQIERLKEMGQPVPEDVKWEDVSAAVRSIQAAYKEGTNPNRMFSSVWDTADDCFASLQASLVDSGSHVVVVRKMFDRQEGDYGVAQLIAAIRAGDPGASVRWCLTTRTSGSSWLSSRQQMHSSSPS